MKSAEETSGMLQIFFFIIGLSVGLLAALIMKNKRSALIGDMIVGVLGSYVGGMIFGAINISRSAQMGSFFAASAGALVFVAVVEGIKKI
jgi:uncharacterized membrane protein YeaQ/YmgE (transglycosylase-associated protein family)